MSFLALYVSGNTKQQTGLSLWQNCLNLSDSAGWNFHFFLWKKFLGEAQVEQTTSHLESGGLILPGGTFQSFKVGQALGIQ